MAYALLGGVGLAGGWQDEDILIGDKTTIYSSYAQKDLVDVLSTLTEEQKNILRSIGLGGLLEMNRMGKNDKIHYQWLLQRFDTTDCTLKIGMNNKVQFGENEICSLLAIRRGGVKEVQKNSGKPTQKLLGLDFGRKVITTAELLVALKRPVHSPMTDDEYKKTSVALVMLACTFFLSPTQRRHSVPRDAYAMTENPSMLLDFVS